MPSQEIKIPKERIPMLIGPKGSTKRKIQKLTNTSIKVNSKEGDVFIESEDGFNCLISLNIVKAIGRGFNPEIAVDLINDDFSLEIIDIHDFSGTSKKKEERLKSRVIGTKGKARNTLEKITNTKICVYGKTISIIGHIEKVLQAKKAIENLLKGSKHGNVYKYVEKEKKKSKLLN